MPHFYVINLERSKERWARFTSSPDYSDAIFTRIDAVDGREMQEGQYKKFSINAFQRKNGRHPRPGEYGCYRSHIIAIEAFASSALECAVVLEDDAKITHQGLKFCNHLDEICPDAPLIVRLTTHRKALYEALADTPNGTTIGQCWFGPTGSAAAYWLNKAAAQKLLQEIAVGDLPFDIILEGSWHHGVPSLVTKPNVFPPPTPPHSDIDYRADPKYQKYPFYKRISVLAFRTSEFFRRIQQNMKTRNLPR